MPPHQLAERMRVLARDGAGDEILVVRVGIEIFRLQVDVSFSPARNMIR